MAHAGILLVPGLATLWTAWDKFTVPVPPGPLAAVARRGEVGHTAPGPLGQGVSVCFMCADAIAIYHELTSRGLAASRPFVGNGLWVTSVQDPDGYRLEFESPTDVPEETEYTG